MVPTLWIVLGWLGQSVTAANGLGGMAHLVLPAPYAEAFEAFRLVYGLPVFGFALLWVASRWRSPSAVPGIAAVLAHLVVVHLPGGHRGHRDQRARRAHPGRRPGLGAGFGYLGLLAAWGIVAARTARGSLRGHPVPAVGVGPGRCGRGR